jgi:hypothetical protein
MEQSIRLPEVEELTRLVQELIVAVQQLAMKVQPAQAWYSRAELAHLKAIPVSAFYNKPWLLPGKPSKQAGVDRWSFKQVWESGWIWKSDADLNPRGGEDGNGTATGTGIKSRVAETPAPLRRVRRHRQGALSGQSG